MKERTRDAGGVKSGNNEEWNFKTEYGPAAKANVTHVYTQEIPVSTGSQIAVAVRHTRICQVSRRRDHVRVESDLCAFINLLDN
jgi:hypothetical protein